MIIEHPAKEDLIGEALIYEHSNNVVYARFRDEPKSSMYPGRWIIGGAADSIAKVKGELTYSQWEELFSLANKHPTLKKQLDKTLDLYYILRNGK